MTRVLALTALLALAPVSQAMAEVIWDLTGLSGGGTSMTVTADGHDLGIHAFGVVNDANVQSNPFAPAAFRGGGAGLGANFLNGNNLDNRNGDLDLLLLELPSDSALPLQLGFNRNDAGDRVRIYIGDGLVPASFAGLSFDDLDALVGSGDLDVVDFSLANGGGVYFVDIQSLFGSTTKGGFLILTIPVGGTSDEFRLASISAEVPEPATAGLFLIALAGLAAVRRRPRRTA
ncbi:MAG: PEP-CTERM sorting domain-containing protein [Pseudomonadota bacterium]